MEKKKEKREDRWGGWKAGVREREGGGGEGEEKEGGGEGGKGRGERILSTFPNSSERGREVKRPSLISNYTYSGEETKGPVPI